MTPAQAAWNTYMLDTYVNNKGETKPTYASKWRKSNPNRHAQILAYKNGTGARPSIPDGFGPMIVSVVDILRAETPPPPVGDKTTYAPLAYNEAPGGEPSARYNVHINCKPHGNGWIDNGGRTYDEGGRCLDHRDTVHVDGLKAANSMDGAESWDPYEWGGKTFPPYPDECYKF